MTEPTCAGDAVWVAKGMKESLRLPFDVEGLEWVVTASIGIGLSTSGRDPSEQIMRRADAAMYRAKEAGKARHAVFDPSANESTSP